MLRSSSRPSSIGKTQAQPSVSHLLDILNDHASQLRALRADCDGLRTESEALRRSLDSARVLTHKAFEEELLRAKLAAPKACAADAAAGVSGVASANVEERRTVSPRSSPASSVKSAAHPAPAQPLPAQQKQERSTTPPRRGSTAVASKAGPATPRPPSAGSLQRRGSTSASATTLERVPSAKRISQSGTGSGAGSRTSTPTRVGEKGQAAGSRPSVTAATAEAKPRGSTPRATTPRSASGPLHDKAPAAKQQPRAGVGLAQTQPKSKSPRREVSPRKEARDLFQAAQPLLQRKCTPDQFDRALAEVRISLENGASPHTWSGGETPLRTALSLERADFTRVLLKAQADPNESDAKGVSVLHTVAFDGHVDQCKALLEGSANPNITDQHGQTPIFFAPSGAACAVLFAHLANVDAVNQKGQTALHLAGRAGLPEVLAWLSAHASKHMLELRDMHGATAAYYARHAGVPPEALMKCKLMTADPSSASRTRNNTPEWASIGAFGSSGPLPPLLEAECEASPPPPNDASMQDEVFRATLSPEAAEALEAEEVGTGSGSPQPVQTEEKPRSAEVPESSDQELPSVTDLRSIAATGVTSLNGTLTSLEDAEPVCSRGSGSSITTLLQRPLTSTTELRPSAGLEQLTISTPEMVSWDDAGPDEKTVGSHFFEQSTADTQGLGDDGGDLSDAGSPADSRPGSPHIEGAAAGNRERRTSLRISRGSVSQGAGNAFASPRTLRGFAFNAAAAAGAGEASERGGQQESEALE